MWETARTLLEKLKVIRIEEIAGFAVIMMI